MHTDPGRSGGRGEGSSGECYHCSAFEKTIELFQSLIDNEGVMINDIKAHLETKPFIPFSIEMNDGRSIRVPHSDHIGVFTYSVAVEDDRGAVRVLPSRNMSGLTIPAQS
jgi:hypothetical protein